ncbi:MAG TPA: NUDIX hydrolase [Candidatus Thorarchaeota archaeon]|nr:MAG: ADP-ribose pyrophosphatase [Candidatus Thorarchaeota archaeon]RLI59271.1 MAG: ADP-ribose pyrophosphatase [Candidatus Thorarchaeota archaeon]HDD67335.1 NUDIX hydrolase [Candidatus Thorarchaeota archaeon]
MYRNPTPTVDIVILKENDLLLIRRGREPFRGKWALPGGFIEYGETAEEAAVREAAEETGLTVELEGILGVYSDPNRDPRKHILTVVFVAHPMGGEAKGGDDASEARWFQLDTIDEGVLAFDHGLIVRDLKRWLVSRDTFWSTRTRN